MKGGKVTYTIEQLKEDLPKADYKELLNIRKVMREERLNYSVGEYSTALTLVIYRLRELMFKRMPAQTGTSPIGS